MLQLLPGMRKLKLNGVWDACHIVLQLLLLYSDPFKFVPLHMIAHGGLGV